MSGTLRLTYRELGERLGISPDGARFLARRRLWKVEKGNDGRALVVVTEADLASEIERSSADHHPIEADHDRLELQERLAAAEVRVGELQTELLQAQVAVARAEERSAGLREMVDREREIARELRAELAEVRKPWWRRWFE